MHSSSRHHSSRLDLQDDAGGNHHGDGEEVDAEAALAADAHLHAAKGVAELAEPGTFG